MPPVVTGRRFLQQCLRPVDAHLMNGHTNPLRYRPVSTCIATLSRPDVAESRVRRSVVLPPWRFAHLARALQGRPDARLQDADSGHVDGE
jgi:hypothetical protein